MSLGLRDHFTTCVLFLKSLGRNHRRAAKTYIDRATNYLVRKNDENSSAFDHFTLLGFRVWRFPCTALPSVNYTRDALQAGEKIIEHFFVYTPIFVREMAAARVIDRQSVSFFYAEIIDTAEADSVLCTNTCTKNAIFA